LTREAIATLKENQTSQKPFFLYMAHYAIHLPYNKDERFYQKYIDKGLTDTEAKYASLIEGMDKSLGDLMDYLVQNKLDQNTYILFMSDNGGLSLSPPRTAPEHSQNYPLKQGKGSLYEGGIRVPMIVSGPGIQQKSVSKQYVGIEDFFSTILDIAAVKKYKTVQQVDGQSFLPFCMMHKNRQQ